MKKQNKLLIRLAIVFTALVLAITVVFVCITLFTKGKSVEVPDVAGKSISDAIDVLQDAGFVVSDEQENIASEDIEAGDVVKTTPAAGSNRKKGSTIKLYVSSGEGTVLVEDYTGKNYLEVKGALTSKGLNVETKSEIITDENSEYKDGDIISQSVEPGEKLNSGDYITLTYAQIGNVYPDFTDGSYTVEDVETFCEEHNLELTIKTTTVGDYLNGTIVKQSRAAGGVVKENASFTITVFEGSEEVETEETEDNGLD